MSEIKPNDHKFKQDSEMSFEEVYRFAYGRYGPLFRNLADELNRGDFMGLLQKASSDSAAASARKRAESLRAADFDAWKNTMFEPERFWKHVLSAEIVEDTDTAFEVKITECLWAKTFRECDAADIGYATICHPDYAYCRAFNPKIRMLRTKTLMQGDEFCNHRWVWED